MRSFGNRYAPKSNVAFTRQRARQFFDFCCFSANVTVVKVLCLIHKKHIIRYLRDGATCRYAESGFPLGLAVIPSAEEDNATPAPLSQDLRRRFERYIENSLSGREAARRLLISPATGVLLARRVLWDEPLVAQKCGRPLGWGKLGAHKALLIELVEQDPYITMSELKGALAEAEGVHVHESSLSRALRSMGYFHEDAPENLRYGSGFVANSLILLALRKCQRCQMVDGGRLA